MSCVRKQFFYGIMDKMEELENISTTTDDFPVYRHQETIAFIETIETIKLTINVIDQLFIIILTSIISWKLVSLNLKKTAMHGFLCTLSALFFLTEGLMTGYRANIFLWGVFPSIQIILHITFNFIAVVLSVAGVICKYKQKKVHFNTRHGKFGVAGLSLLGLNILCGFCFFLISTTKVMAFMHAILSIATYVAIMVAQITAYNSGFFQRNFYYIICFKVVTGLIVFLSFDSLFEFLIDLVLINYLGPDDLQFKSRKKRV